MKKLMAITLTTLACTSFAAEEYISPVTGKPLPTDGKFTAEQLKARDERVMKKTGGFLEQKAEGPRALFIDARAKATLTVDELKRLYDLGTHLESDILKEPRGATDPLAFAQAKMASANPLMVVMVVEGCPLPALSVYPEERIGIVNADKLKGATEDLSAPEMRVSKELWRAIGFVCGIGFSMQPNDIMQPYYSLKELDDNRYPFIQPMNMAKMQPMCKRFGVKKARRVPYSVACEEGWAPAPTNDYQKAVWEKVHATPEKPMKIEFDAQKGR